MFSQTTHFFSQEEDISQFSSPFIGDKTTNQNVESSSQVERIEVAHHSSEYDELVASQADHPSSSARADAVCQQNRQLRGYLENNLKQIEKKRIKLFNKNKNLEEKINILKDKQKCECQQSVDLQMSMEKVSENYQNELSGQKNLKEKLDHIQVIIDYFDYHYSDISRVVNEFKQDKQDLKIELEKLYSDLKVNVDEKSKLKLSYNAKVCEKTQKAQETSACLRETRETDLSQISVLFGERCMNLNNKNDLQEKISSLLNKRNKMNDSYVQLVHDKKLMKENFVKLLQQMDELNTTTVSATQNLKLQILNEQNTNSNLQLKSEENDKFINITSKKEKELINLYNQMNRAIEEIMKKQEYKQEKVNKHRDKNSIISNDIKKLEQEIIEYQHCEKSNELLKSEVKRLEVSNTAKEFALQEKENSVSKISEEEEQLKKEYNDNLFNIQKFNTELEICLTHQNDLTIKLKEEQIKNQTERDAKIRDNKSLEMVDCMCSSTVKGLISDLEIAQNLNCNANSDKMKISILIEEYCKRKAEADEQLKINEIELDTNSVDFQNNIDLKDNTLDDIEKYIIDATPYQEELIKLLSRKESLSQDIQQQKENHYKEIESLKRNFNSKIKEISREKEKLTAIVEGIIKVTVETTEELKQKINKADAVRVSHDTDLQNMLQQITNLKHEEPVKRLRVARLEKRLKTILNEISVTSQDLNDAITGNVKNQTKEKSTAVCTIPSSKRSLQNLHQEPPGKKVAMAPNPYDSKNMIQTKTKHWEEASLNQDEYEFSDI